METTTKQRILDEALVCFAENGYRGTNLRDFAARLGLSKSALYKHYESKEAIWNAMLDGMEEYYRARFGTPEKLPTMPTTCEALYATTMNMLRFTMHDPKVILTRRLLTTEQFRDDRARRLATQHFLTSTKEMHTKIFAGMMEAGAIKDDDPEMLAFAYTAPITELIHLCDREPEKEPEIMQQLDAFVRHFIKTYGRETDPAEKAYGMI